MNYHIAMDGPAGSGKSTISKIIAKNNNLEFISTGFLFRAFAYILREKEILNFDDNSLIDLFKKNNINLSDKKIFVNNIDITEKIKSEEISSIASKLATKLFIREYYNEKIRELIKDKNVIIDGRDIGTVLLPKANLKIYLTASIYQRAKRRTKELMSQNKNIFFIKIWFDIFKRDWNDKHRKIAPLKKAKDAIKISTNNKSIDQVVSEIQKYIKI